MNKVSLLFGAIIYVASRQYTDDPSLSITLVPMVKRLLWETMVNPPRTWYPVQVILLICMWPFPTSSLSTDTASMLINIAQAMAMQLGLDQPGPIQDFSRTKRKLSSLELLEALKIWFVCYIASQEVRQLGSNVRVNSSSACLSISLTHVMLPASSSCCYAPIVESGSIRCLLMKASKLKRKEKRRKVSQKERAQVHSKQANIPNRYLRHQSCRVKLFPGLKVTPSRLYG